MQDNVFEVINKDSDCELILTCEHAGNEIPNEYEYLSTGSKKTTTQKPLKHSQEDKKIFWYFFFKYKAFDSEKSIRGTRTSKWKEIFSSWIKIAASVCLLFRLRQRCWFADFCWCLFDDIHIYFKSRFNISCA